jgi:Holliday junction resolvase RusA-like endonuclease
MTHAAVTKEGHGKTLFVRAPLPPSDNKLYVTVGRRRVLSAEGTRYKNSLLGSLAHVLILAETFDPNTPTSLRMNFHFQVVETKKGDPRFKKQDVHNRGKLLADILTSAVGVDDSTLLTTITSKRQGDDFVECWLYSGEDAQNMETGAFRRA